MSVRHRLGAVLRVSSAFVVIAILAWVASAALATGPSAGFRLINARAGHTATAQIDGTLLIAGGKGDAGVVKSLEFFDPVNGKSTPGQRLFEARSGHSAIALTDGRVLLAGGHNGDNELLASTEIYDTDSGILNPGAGMHHARANHTATMLADGRVLIAGGDASGVAEIYDPARDRFESAGRLSVARAGHSAIRLDDGRVLLVGGYNAAGATAEIFDPQTNTFAVVRSGLKTSRVQPTLKLLSDGKVQVYGGDAEITMEIYNPAGYFSSRGHLVRDSGMFRAVMYSPGQAALVTIPGAHSRRYAEEALGPAANTFERASHTTTELSARSMMVVVGGVGASGSALDSIAEIGSCGGTVTTDLTDYYPGQTVVMSGSGWTPGEQITLNLHRDTNEPPDTVLYATADENGDWINSDYVVQEFDLGVTFVLTATGDSGCTAQTTFTDSTSIKSVSVGAQAPNPVTSGSTATYTVTVAFNGNGNNGGCSATLSTTGLPAGTGINFSPNPVPGDQTETVTSTLTITPTSAGTYPFTVSATAPNVGNGGCNGSTVTTPNPLPQLVVVDKPASTTVVTFEAGPYVYRGTAFTATATVTGVGGLNQSVPVVYSGDCTNVTVTNGCTATATFAGDNNNGGSSDSKSITITKATSTTAVVFEAGPYVYRGTPFTATATVTGAGSLNQSVAVVYSGDCTNVTAANGCTATATFGGDQNHSTSTDNKSITITKAGSTTAVVFEAGPYVYRGTPFTATATVTGAGSLNQSVAVVYSGDCTNVTAANGCTATATFGGDQNHSTSTDNKSITITKAASTTAVVFEAGPYVYRGTPFTATATVTGAGSLNQSVAVVYSGDCTNVTAANGCTATATFGGDQNHSTSTDNKSITITKAASTTAVVFEAGPYVYRGTPFTATATVTGAGSLNQSVAVVYSGDCTNVTAANGCTATATFGGDQNHSTSTDNKSITITKAASTTAVVFEAGPYVYRGTPFTATATVTGAGNLNQSVAVVYSGDCTNVTAANGCTATATFGGDQNHSTSTDNKSITITQATSTTVVTFEAGPYVYRGTPFTATAAVTGINLSQPVVPVTYTGDCTNVTVAGCTANATFGGDQNHSGSMGSANITITQATSTTVVTFEAGPYVYRGTPFTATAAVTGINLSQPVVPVTYTGDCTNVTVAGCTANATFGGDQNHSGSMGSANITITQATSTTVVTFEAGPYVYRGTPFTATAAVTGINLSQPVVPVTYTGDCTNVTVAGCTANATFGGDQNHSGSMGSANITITQATSTTVVTFEAGPYVYRGTPFTATAAVTGINLSQPVVPVTYTGDCTNVTVAGCTANATFGGDQNHSGSMGSANITITQATSTTVVTFEAGPYVYRGTPFTATAAVTGINLSQPVVPVTYTGDCTNVTVAGCTANATFGGDQNHSGSMGSANITITQATSTTVVTFEAGPYVYRTTPFTAKANVTGIGGLNQPVVPVTYTGDCTNVTVAGCTAKATFGGDQNHSGSMGSASITITPAPSTIAVTCPVAHLTYTGLPQTPCTAMVTGVGGLSQSLTVSYTNNTNAGTAGASASFPGDTNHLASMGSSSFIIDQASSTTTVTCPSTHLTYTGLPQTPCTAKVTGVGGLSLSLAVSYTNNTNAGTAGASASFLGDTNHMPSSGSSSFVIDKVQLTVRADNINKLFGDPITLTYKITGFVNGETVVTAPVNGAPNCTTTATQWSVVSPPTYPITCTIGTLAAANYTFTFVGGTLTITPRSALVNYIGQQTFVTSGSSSTTAQVTLSASVQDPTGLGLSGAKVDFIDATPGGTGKALATGVPVSPVQNALFTGTANVIVTLSTGQYGSQSYQILVQMTGNYDNKLQPLVDKTAAVIVMQPPASYQTTGGGTFAGPSTAAGAYAGNGDGAFCVGLTYTSKLTNLKGQISLTIPQADGTVYVKSNSLSSMAVTGTGDSQSATIYAKSSMIEVINGTTVTIDGNVTLRMDVTEGKPGNPGSVGFTVLSSKDSSLYYSNNWQSVPPTTPPGGQNVWKTVLEDFTGTVMISD